MRVQFNTGQCNIAGTDYIVGPRWDAVRAAHHKICSNERHATEPRYGAGGDFYRAGSSQRRNVPGLSGAGSRWIDGGESAWIAGGIEQFESAAVCKRATEVYQVSVPPY